MSTAASILIAPPILPPPPPPPFLLPPPNCSPATFAPEHGIYEGPVVKPKKVQIFDEQKSAATSPSPSASVDLPSHRSTPMRGELHPSAQHPLSPRRREIVADLPPPLLLRAGADVAQTLKHLSGFSPTCGQSHLTKYERRHHSPGRRSHDKSWSSCHASGSSFQSRHDHLDRLYGSPVTHACYPPQLNNHHSFPNLA